MTPAKNEPKCHHEQSLLLGFLWMDGWLMRLLTGESCTGDGRLEFGTHTYVCVCHTPPPPIRNQREIVHAWSTFFLAYGVQQHYSYVTLSTNWKTNKWCEFPHKIHSQRFQPFQVLIQINVFLRFLDPGVFFYCTGGPTNDNIAFKT